ncbi:hypothetical protein JCM3774_003724 [Rhodotorula dairenensis]
MSMSALGTETLSVVASKTLPSALHLPKHALSPTTPSLVVLTSAPDATADPKVVLYRLTAHGADSVWEWTPPPPPAPPAPAGKFGGLGLKGKAKAQVNAGKVEQTVWSPDGKAIGVVSSHANAAPTLTILSVHSGQPLLAPLSSPSRPHNSSACTLASWSRVPYAADLQLESWALRIINRLPALPKIDKGTLTAPGTDSPGGPGAAGGLGGARIGGPGGAGAGGGGVFGAKQAMLERERAKEAQRPLSMRDAAPQFPTLLPSIDALDAANETDDLKILAMLGKRRADDDVAPSKDGSVPTAREQTLSLLAGEKGDVQLFFGGCVQLGSVHVGGRVLAVIPIPPSPAHPIDSRVAVHVADPSGQVAVRILSVSLRPTLGVVVRQSSASRAFLEHAFEALQEARNLWDEARRIGKGWLQRVADVSRPHGVTHTPITQLHLLLVTGRPTRSLHDFLASKLNERGLFKWEQAMSTALERLREVTWTSLVPALERTLLLIQEIDAWARWPEKFGEYGFNRAILSQAVEAAKQGVRSAVRLQREVEEEERCFKHFGAWLHYEVDKVAAQEGSEVRPTANFQPLPVSHYIQHCLPSTAASVSSFLSFGLASASLSNNADLAAVDEWLASVVKRDNCSTTPTRAVETSLIHVLKRLQQELRGQIDGEKLEREREGDYEAALRADDIARILRPPLALAASSTRHQSQFPDERPHVPFASRPGSDVGDLDARPQSPTDTDNPPASAALAPKSLPALLHTVARLLGTTFSDAISGAAGQTVLDVASELLPDASLARARVVRAANASTWLCSFVLSGGSGSAPYFRYPVTQSAQDAIESTDAHSIMLVQLLMYGHDDLASRPPQRTSNFLRICEREKRPRYAAMMRHFGQFSTWDCVKLLAFCLLGGATACGWYLTFGLRNDPVGFEIEIPRGFEEKSFFMGLSACLIFAAARLPECYSGWARSHRGQEPIHSLSDPLFYFLIIENVFYLASILTLSTDRDYLIAETPFIAGAAIPIAFDLLMLFSMLIWHRRWRRLDTPYARRLRMQAFARSIEELKQTEERIRLERLREMDDICYEADQTTDIYPPTASRAVRRRLQARNMKILFARADLDANRPAFDALRGSDLDKTYTYSVTEL